MYCISYTKHASSPFSLFLSSYMMLWFFSITIKGNMLPIGSISLGLILGFVAWLCLSVCNFPSFFISNIFCVYAMIAFRSTRMCAISMQINQIYGFNQSDMYKVHWYKHPTVVMESYLFSTTFMFSIINFSCKLLKWQWFQLWLEYLTLFIWIRASFAFEKKLYSS